MKRAPLLARSDVAPIAALFVLSLALHFTSAVLGARLAGVPLAHLGVYYDGLLYIEIAKSFPLPYGPEAFDYAGQAPGYPALIALLRLFSPPGMVNWAVLALLGTWLPAALCTVVFYGLCKEVTSRPFWPALLFVLANPRWATISAASHPEPLALLLALGSVWAYFRGRLFWCVALLSLATLTRFPALLIGAALAFGLLVLQRDLRARSFGLLALPLVAFGLLNVYLWLRIPEFPGVFEAHQVFWKTELTWPFHALYQHATRAAWGKELGLFEVTYGSLAVYLLSLPLGFWRCERRLWVLPVWVAAVVVPHASLSGILGAWDFTRLVMLAWPACLLILWHAGGHRLPAGVVVAVALALGSFSLWFSHNMVARAVALQAGAKPLFDRTIRNLGSDEPRFFDFRGLSERRDAERRRQQRRRP